MQICQKPWKLKDDLRVNNLILKTNNRKTLKSNNLTIFKGYLNHPCIRDCQLDETPRTCEYDWTLEFYSTASRACHNCPQNHTDCERENCIFADGLKKSIEVVNRLFPGPSIQVCRGDTIVVRLTNSVRSARVTSIHWHGLKQFMEPYMDGVGMVTQYPILPHTSFVYKFVARDVGTHFWHSHSGVQRGVWQ